MTTKTNADESTGWLLDWLLDLALAANTVAQESGDPNAIAVAQLLDAAWLVRNRAQAGDLDTGDSQLTKLRSAAAKYLEGRGAHERWAFAALPPPSYERSKAVKQLCARAVDAKALMARARNKDTADIGHLARVVAFALTTRAIELGLTGNAGERELAPSAETPADAGERQPALPVEPPADAGERELAPSAETPAAPDEWYLDDARIKQLAKHLKQDAPDHLLAEYAMRAAGVSPEDARNWARSG